MSTSKLVTLDFYDENTDEHKVSEYYRIIPEEKYEVDLDDDYIEIEIEIEFEVPDFAPACPPSQHLGIVLAYRATVDQCDEIPELIIDIRTSKYKIFEVLVKEICYEKFLKTLRSKIPDLRIEMSKVKDGYFIFKLEF